MRSNAGTNRASGLFLLLCVGFCASVAPGQERPSPRVSVEDARRLVYEAVRTRGPGITVSETRALDANFYFFDATWPNPTGSPMIGYFAVYPWTGDVWDYNACRRLDSSGLRKLQQEIRRSSGIGRVSASLRNRKLICIEPGQK